VFNSPLSFLGKDESDKPRLLPDTESTTTTWGEPDVLRERIKTLFIYNS